MSKVKKKQAGSSNVFASVTVAFISVVIGALLGFWMLASERVAPVREPVPQEKRDFRKLYFLTGDTSGAVDWEGKRDWLLRAESGSVKVRTPDINAWLSSTFRSPQPSGNGSSLVPRNPNVRLEGETLQFAVRLDIDTQLGSVERMLIVKGTLVQTSGGPRFRTSGASFGAARVPPFLAGAVMQWAKGLYPLSEEYETAFASLADASIENGSLILSK